VARFQSAVLMPLAILLGTPLVLTATHGTPPGGVQVTPDGSTSPERRPYSNGYSALFKVKNIGSSTVTFTLTRESSANVTTTGQDYAQVTLAPGDSINVNVYYNVGAPGLGYVKLWAEGSSGIDSGTWNVPVSFVSPDGQTASARITQTGGYSETFTVTNNGTVTETYSLTCSGSTNISCTGVTPLQLTLNVGAQATVVAAYNVSSAGTGTLRVVAISGAATDTGSYSVPVNNPTAGAPLVDASPMYGHFSQALGRCAASCFAATYAQSTVPYFSLDAPRSLTVAYHGDRVDPRPFIHVNVRRDSTYGQTPTEYRLQVKVNGAFITFRNGEQLLKFSYPGNFWARLGAQVDTVFSTGVYPMDIIVTAYYASGSNLVNTWSTKLVVVNENPSSVARGWKLAGIQQVYVQGDGSALITEGDGSAVYFAKVGSVFVRPAGDFSQLINVQPGGGAGWTRSYPDSTKVVFNSSGRMIKVLDRFSSRDSVVYDGSNRVTQVKDPLNNTITLSYDAYGLTSIQDPMSRVTDVVVNVSNQLISITDPDNFSTTFGYDASQRLSFVTNRAGQRDTLSYLVINSKQTNKLASAKAPSIPIFGGGSANPVTNFETWHTKGVPYVATAGTAFPPPKADTVYARITEPLGASYVSRFTVNSWGSPAVTTNALGEVTTIVYNNAGLPWTIQKPGFGGVLDTLLYNGSGLVTYARPAGDSSRSITYGAWAQPTKDSTPGRRVVTYTIGTNGTVTNVGWGGVTRESYLYDSYGRPTRVTDAFNTVVRRLGYPTTGALRNLTHDTLPGTRVTVHSYDSYGRDTSVTPPAPSPRQVAHYNLANLVDSLRVLTGPVMRVKFAYDRLGRDTMVTDTKNQVYRYSYNALGWLIKQLDPIGVRDTFQYNVGGELKRSTNRLNQNIDFSYDVLHRLTSRAGSLTSTWTYTANSLVVIATQPNVATVTTYPSLLGPPDSVKTVLNGKTYWQRYRYTSAGIDSVYFTGSQDAIHLTGRRYRYNVNTGALDSIRLAGLWTKVSHDLTMAITALDLPGSAGTTSTMGSLHAPLTTTTETANSLLFERWLGFNTLGQIDRHLRQTAKIGRWFTYDSLGQLRTARNRLRTPDGTPPSCPNFDYGMSGSCTPDPDYVTLDSTAFTYDSAGNRTDKGGSYAVGNRITSFDNCTYKTDAAGSVVSRKGASCAQSIDTLLWTKEGWLDSLQVGNTGIKFLYDANGRLTVKRVNGAVVSRFLWDGSNLLAEINSLDSVAVEYSYYEMDMPHAVIKQPLGPRLYARLDGIGNVLALTDSGGSMRTSYNYDDWGKLTSSTDNEGFNGRDRARWKGALWIGPELDLYYMRARWYEPQSGRFLSEDPIGLKGGINRYAFALNDPVNFTDPSGEQGWPVIAARVRNLFSTFFRVVALKVSGGVRTPPRPDSFGPSLPTRPPAVSSVGPPPPPKLPGNIRILPSGEGVLRRKSGWFLGGFPTNEFGYMEYKCFLWGGDCDSFEFGGSDEGGGGGGGGGGGAGSTACSYAGTMSITSPTGSQTVWVIFDCGDGISVVFVFR